MGESKIEVWKDVVGYEGFYSISSIGRVRRDLEIYGRCVSGKILKQSIVSQYYIVGLSKLGVKKMKYIHILVAEAFIGERPFRYEVNHKDGNKLNCHYKNLEYLTQSENTKHAYKLGLIPMGASHARAKLTQNNIDEIKRLSGPRIRNKRILAKRFNVDIATIFRVLTK